MWGENAKNTRGSAMLCNKNDTIHRLLSNGTKSRGRCEQEQLHPDRKGSALLFGKRSSHFLRPKRSTAVIQRIVCCVSTSALLTQRLCERQDLRVSFIEGSSHSLVARTNDQRSVCDDNRLWLICLPCILQARPFSKG